MSINQNFPEIRPSLNLNFARSKTLDPRITFTRASTATYVDEDGLIKTAVSDEARFDHDPVTGESLGLLIEESRKNLIKYSEPDNRSSGPLGTEGVWSFSDLNSNSDITKVLGPDGVSNSASQLDLHTGTASDSWDTYARVGPTGVTAGQKCTFSAWVKLGTATNFVLVPNDTTNWNYIPDGWRSFDASDGLNTTSFTKVSHTFTSPSNNIINLHIGDHSSNFTTQQTAGTVIVWGCQFEMGDFDTSTLITDGSAVTRSPDITSIEGNKFAKTNLLTYSEQFDQWTVAANSIITPNAIAAPDGTFTADQVYFSENGYTNISQSITLTQNQTYTISVYAKAVTPGTNNKFVPYIDSPTVRFPNDFEATSEWQRFTFTFTHTNATASTSVYFLNKGDTYITNVYFWGAQLEEGELTEYTPSVESFVSRASSATYVDDATGLIKTSPINYAINSEQVDLWFLSRGSISANFAESPIGDLTADKWTPNTVSNFHFAKLTTTLSSTSSVTHSIYAKQAGYRYLLVNTTAGSALGNAGPVVDLQDGVVVGNFTATYPTTVTDAGNGWWRVAITFAGNGSNIIVDHNPLPTSTVVAYAGDGTSGVLLWGAQLEANTTTASPYIKTGSTISGAARYENGELLLEEARTNELTFSSTLDAYGTSSIASKTQNAGIAPDGTNTAVLAETISTGIDSHLRELTSQVVNATYTYSFFAKPGTVDYAVVYNIAKNGVGLTWFNVANGTIGTTASGVTPFIKPAGNGWYRVGVTLTTDSTITNNIVDIRWTLSDGVSNPTAGENVYVWGAQLEAGSFPTSYIPTDGTPGGITRAADVSTSALGVDSWYNQSEGTVYSDITTQWLSGRSTNGTILQIDNGTNATGRLFHKRKGSSGSHDVHFSGIDVSIAVPTYSYKAASGYNTSSFITCVDKTLSGEGNVITGDLNTLNRAQIGNNGNNILNGHISRLAYYQTRLSDDKLKSITSKRNPYRQSIVYNITNSGGTFILRSFGTVNYNVSWNNDESYEESTSNTLSHTYSAGNHFVRVYSNDVYRPYFNNVTADASQITSVTISSSANLGTDLTYAWYGANNMTSFACQFDVTSSVTSFYHTWYGCSSLTSFPLLNTSSGITFNQSWRDCTSLTSFPANMFDATGTLVAAAFTNAWLNCALTAQSIENILVSLDTNGATGITLGINGGNNAAKATWSAAAVTAYDNLIVKGWTIFFNA